MKKLLILTMVILGTISLIGCGKTQIDEVKESTEEIILEETILEETILEENVEEEVLVDELLEGKDKYSKEYIGELYWNCIFVGMSYEEVQPLVEYGRALEEVGYSDEEIEYILVKRCGLL